MCGTGTYLDELDERTPAIAEALAEANRRARLNPVDINPVCIEPGCECR